MKRCGMQLQFNLYEAFFNLNPSSNNYIRYLQMKTLISKIRSIFQQNVRSETPSLKSLIEEKGVHELSNFSCFLCSIVSYWKSWTLTWCSKGGIMSEKCQRLKKYSKSLSTTIPSSTRHWQNVDSQFFCIYRFNLCTGSESRFRNYYQ